MSILTLDPFLSQPSVEVAHFQVEVDRTRCATVPTDVEGALRDAETNGIELSLEQIFTHAGIELAGSVVDHWGKGEPAARIKRVMDDLSQWRPRYEIDASSGKRRLIVIPPANLDERPAGARRWGTGVGLLVASRVYDLPYRFWRATGGKPHDLEAPARGGGIIKVEVRARVNRNHWNEARDEVYRKLPPPGDFAAAAGILFAPRTTLARRAADILIMDPEGENMSSRDHHMLRGLLQHYAQFFERQGGFPPCKDFARRLRELADAPEDQFQEYLVGGDEVLRRKSKPYRTSFRFRGAVFQGTAYYGTAWPEAMTGVVAEPGRGAFYWGLWSDVIGALQEGRLQDIADMTVRPGSQRVGGKVFVLLDDGTALAWAPSKEALTGNMFEGLDAAEPAAPLAMAGM